jgi:hypothetical protein
MNITEYIAPDSKIKNKLVVKPSNNITVTKNSETQTLEPIKVKNDDKILEPIKVKNDDKILEPIKINNEDNTPKDESIINKAEETEKTEEKESVNILLLFGIGLLGFFKYFSSSSSTH